MGKCYFILYDLRAPGRDYNGLYNAIKNYGIWGHLTESAWAIVTTQSASEIANNLRAYIDSNDRLMVVRSGKEASWYNCRAKDEWIKRELIK